MNIYNKLCRKINKQIYIEKSGITGKPVVKCISAVLTVFVTFWLVSIPTRAAGPKISEQTQEIVYPANQFDDGKARFYDFKTDDGVKIKYFIIKS